MTDKYKSPKVKRITGILYPIENENLLKWSIDELTKIWGVPEIFSDSVPFDKTNYYDEISPNLTRIFLCFPGLVDAGGLADWKHQSIEIEARSRENIRAVNIDPGYVDGARLILASTKDHAHRIYLRDGIYAEVTLRYRFKQWQSFDYTFPDFQSRVYDKFLSQVRKLWLQEIKEC
ncbi:MAG: DUF4416 family protein [Synergistaceae bacterium]|nr:DUF4416 family protein [Synergistaceae bacterium]MBQ6434388.1 DUF4416 family protein [Synergistaceae bacterium]MBQ7069067.1 DUF4416 family protein [Synergistaceae bacterium]MBR0075334.1 DUF4416 family protein [Synergistaceae bacterium]MBR0079212.1 DUF4416 family protein [Synergistaceae bacterium]